MKTWSPQPSKLTIFSIAPILLNLKAIWSSIYCRDEEEFSCQAARCRNTAWAIMQGFSSLCFLSLFPVTYIQFIFLLQMKVCQLRHQDAETLMTMVAARFLPGWRATKRRRRKMACVRGEVSFNRIMLWTVMNWWNLGGLLCCKLPELSCGSH